MEFRIGEAARAVDRHLERRALPGRDAVAVEPRLDLDRGVGAGDAEA